MNINFSPSPSVIPIASVKLANLIFLNVTINDQIYPLLFDTGASITVVNEEIAQKVGLRILDKSVKGSGNAGKWIETKMGEIKALQIGENTFLDMEVAVLPSENLTFVIDEKNTKMKINGFMGWDIIQHFKWTIYKSNETIKMEKPAPQECISNLIYDIQPTISVAFKGELLNFGFDSGNTESILGIKMFERIQPLQQKSDSWIGVDGTIEQTVFDVEEFKFRILDKLIRLQHVPLIQQDVYHAKRVESMGLLSSDIVANKDWVIDFFNHHFEILE
jgi:hypothetical protein